jgi:outer membrane protein assembly factor BamB
MNDLSPPRRIVPTKLLQFRLRTLLALPLVVAIVLVGYRSYLQYRASIAPASWDVASGQNIKWSFSPGHAVMFGPPVVSGGRVFVGTARCGLPGSGELLCLRAEDGQIVWRAKTPALGIEYDFPTPGIASAPRVEGDRLWYVTNRCEVVCLDTEGFHDGENDGPVQDEPPGEQAADVVWRCDMFGDLGVRPHERCPCLPAIDGQRVFVVTGNGVARDHHTIENPAAPSFLALDKRTGKVLWSDNSPGEYILHTQWGSPVCAVLAGVPQVIFPGGDGWLYSFDPAGTPEGKSKLLWKFDLNAKASLHQMGGHGTRNEQCFEIVLANDRVYATCGQDPEHGVGPGRLWCLDPSQRGDVSSELVRNSSYADGLAPVRRYQAADAAAGDVIVPNPNSAVVWRYDSFDLNGDGKIDEDYETMHRSLGGVAIHNGLLLATDLAGFVHCLDANSGRPYWVHDLLGACWTGPIISGGKAYVCDEEGKVSIFPLDPATAAAAPKPSEINMLESIYSRPVVSNRVLYLATRGKLYAIAEEGD